MVSPRLQGVALMDDAVLQADAELVLTEFGEEITYTPSGGSPRSILAIVDRNPPEDIPEAPAGGMQKGIMIEVANRETSIADDDIGGIGSAEVDTGGDIVTLAVRIGVAAQVRPIARIIEQDVGMLQLEVR